MNHFGLIDKSAGAKVPLESIRIQASIHGYTAEVKATMEYKNNQQNPIEAIYILPLDEEAAVCGFQATIDGRTIVAEVQEKQEARDTYDDAISSGHSAFLLEESDESSDIFQINVGNLPPGKSATVELTFVTELAVEKDGRVVFVLPTVLNPKYCPAESQSTTSSVRRQQIAGSVDTKYAFDFELQVQGASEIQEITSPHSKIKVVMNPEDKTRATVTLDKAYKFDVDVQIHVLARDPFLPHALVEDGVTIDDKPDKLLTRPVVTLNFLPEDIGSLETGEFIFVVDRSGSMSGSNIKNARETLLLFLKSLPSECHFNVIGFGSSFEKLFPTSTKYCDSSVKKACELAEVLEANLGGTEILSPLQDVFSQPLIKGCPRQLFLLTDGAVFNTEQVIAEVRRNSNTARCFAFGIGQGASTALIKGVARAGKGSAEFITTNERMQPKVIKTLRNALQPVLEDVKVEWDLPKGWSAETVPSSLPPIFGSNRLVVYGLLNRRKGDAQKNVDVEGKATLCARRISDLTGQSTTIKHEIQFKVVKTGSSTPEGSSQLLHRLAAKRSIQERQDSMSTDKEKAHIISISKSANVVSKVTSFVAVDKENHTPITGPMTHPGRHESIDRLAEQLQCASASQFQCKRARNKKGGIGFSFSALFGFNSAKTSRKKGLKKSASVPKSALQAPAACRYSMSNEYDPTIEDEYDSTIEDSYHIEESCKGIKNQRRQESSSVKPPSSESSPLKVIVLQTASGAWGLTDELAKALDSSVKDFQGACPSGLEKAVWATALALAWLHGKCADKQDEWEMVGEKGKKFLKKNLTSQSYQEVMENAAATLGVVLPASGI